MKFSTTYAYDAQGRIATINGTQANRSFTFQYGYLPGTAIPQSTTLQQYPFQTTKTFEPGSTRVSNVTNSYNGSLRSAFAYTHDILGRRTARNDTFLEGASLRFYNNTYAYNSRSELTNSVTTSPGYPGYNYNYSYTYDNIGNPVTRSYAHNPKYINPYTANALNQISEAHWPWVYDADGNLTEDWLEWDEAGRLKTMFIRYEPTTEYEYDHLGRRISKTQYDWGEPWQYTRFIYDNNNLVAELDCDPETGDILNVTFYLWGLDISHTFQGAGGVGGLLAQFSPNQTYLPCYDAHGTVHQYLTTSGTVATNFKYDPFGYPINSSPYAPDELPFRFSTKYWDWETEFYYHENRYYWPYHGRFISRDPIEESGGLNLYAYCKNDPINKWDYLGLEVEGNYFFRIVTGIHVYPSQRRGGAPEKLDGFEVEYIPAANSKYNKDDIRLVQAVIHPTLGHQIDTSDFMFWANANSPEGMPLPAYTVSGRAGKHGPLSYIDAPWRSGWFTDEEIFETTFHLETCALCNCDGVDKNIGCVTFSFGNKTRRLNVNYETNIAAQEPTNLWKTAEAKWKKAAGSSLNPKGKGK